MLLIYLYCLYIYCRCSEHRGAELIDEPVLYSLQNLWGSVGVCRLVKLYATQFALEYALTHCRRKLVNQFGANFLQKRGGCSLSVTLLVQSPVKVSRTCRRFFAQFCLNGILSTINVCNLGSDHNCYNRSRSVWGGIDRRSEGTLLNERRLIC